MTTSNFMQGVLTIMKIKGSMLAVSAILVFALAGCGGGGNAGNANTGGAANNGGAATVDAQAIYKKNCVSCHGDNLEGKVGPNSNIAKVGSRLQADQIAAVIANGRGGMPSFKGRLQDAEIGALADWLAAKK
jgi:cytochrome c551